MKVQKKEFNLVWGLFRGGDVWVYLEAIKLYIYAIRNHVIGVWNGEKTYGNTHEKWG